MKVSVLVPCFNEADTIEECLTRVSESDLADKEVIVVDDTSC
jgi:glycosyltransferase involved in cell wall biosynthesis